MFFSSVERTASGRSERKLRGWHKGAAAIALAVAAAAPAICPAPTSAAMSEAEQALAMLAAAAAPTDPQLLSQGIAEFSKGQYERAQVTLQQVKLEGLDQADRDRLRETMEKVEAALNERQAARAAFAQGEEAMAQGNIAEALTHYRAAADNKFADEATRSKALSQIAVAEARQAGAAGESRDAQRALYREAQADYRAGDLAAARAKFARLQEAGFRGGLFDRRPSSYIAEIDQKIAQAEAAAAAPAVQPQPQEEPQPQPPVAETPAAPTGADHYRWGVEAYQNKDYEVAREHFQKAIDMGYRGPFLKTTSQRYLAMIEQATREPVPAPPPPAPVAEQPATPPPPAVGLSPAEADRLAAQLDAQLRQEQRAYEAQQLVAAAQKARQENRLNEAYQMYSRAAQLDPSNQAAVAGARETQTLVVGASGASMIDAVLAAESVQKQAIRYRFEQALSDARKATAEQRFDEADRAINSARVARDAGATLFTVDQLNEFNAQIANAQTDLMRAREIAQRRIDQEQQRAAAQDAERRKRLAEAERRRTVAELIRNARELIYEGSYGPALGVLNQILSLDPANEYALGAKQLVQDYETLAIQRKFKEEHDRQFERQLNAAAEKQIPYMDLMTYPANWPDISERRDQQVLEERRAQAGYAQLSMNDLNRRMLRELNLDDAPLVDALRLLRDYSGLNIFVKWNELEKAGVTRTTPVTLHLQNVPFAKSLDVMLSAAGGRVPLSYAIDANVITVSTINDLNRKTVTNVYDIQDLLAVAPDVTEPPGFSGNRPGSTAYRQQNANANYYGDASYYRGGAGYQGGAPPISSDSRTTVGHGAGVAARTGIQIEQLRKLLLDHIDRDSWIDNGGSVGSLQFLNGQLIVTQTQENQTRIVSLLERLRQYRAIQVSVETRFLQIQRNFLNDIGLDLDFFFNINSPNRFSPISVQSASSVFPATPTTPVPGSIGANAQPSITVQGSFLDDFQVNFLIRATQASLNSTIVTAPRVTVFNGQQAWVVVSSEQAYVSDLEPVTGENVGLFNPIIDIIPSGVTLVVTPTVSADRKYVTMALNPQVRQLVSLVSFPVFGLTTGGTTTGTGGTGTGGQSITFSANVQLPLSQFTSVYTIVAVPDQGTLLLGGQTLAGEIEVEQGVPILSKIPFIKRLFTNKSTAKDEQVLLILVKPIIIIQQEEEQKNFPLLVTQP